MLTRRQLDAWVADLRSYPEKQLKGILLNTDLTKACCLGQLCLTTNQQLKSSLEGMTLITADVMTQSGILTGPIARQFGDSHGIFSHLNMPSMRLPLGHPVMSATQANDHGCTWAEIADHFEQHYPCCEDF